MSANFWKTHLQDGETIVWQGRPDNAFSIGMPQLGKALFGVFFAGFAVFWMVMAASGGGNFWMFGLLHFGVGAAMVAWALFGDTFRRRRSWYTLTNKRAFIATDMPLRGRALKSYPITSSSVIEYRDADRPSIMFVTEIKRSNRRDREVAIGFERLGGAQAVLGHIQKIQQGDL